MENEEAVTGIHFKINLLDALHFIKRAWDKVKPETINNCFCKAESNANFELLWNNPQLEKFVGDIVISEEIDDDDVLNQVRNEVTSLEEDSSDQEEYHQAKSCRSGKCFKNNQIGFEHW